MTYYQQYDTILAKYSGLIAQANSEYDALATQIEAKEITAEYTQEDQEAELAANETARTNAIAALNEQKQAELIQFNATYAQQSGEVRAEPIDYDFLDNKIGSLNFTVPTAPTYTQEDLTNIANVMAEVPKTIYNTKFIYLTFKSKYEALEQLSTQEHETYSDAYDAIVDTYAGYADQINATYDGYKTTIESKEITEQYTAQDQEDELAANETAREEALDANETAKNNEIAPLNQAYLETLTTIGKAFTALKTDNETGFAGDVHINGDLRIDGELINTALTTALQTMNTAIGRDVGLEREL